MKRDDININEAYGKVYNQKQLEEGWYDTAKAQVKGAVAGLAPGKRLGAMAASGLGKVAGAFNQQAGQNLQQTAQQMRQDATNKGIVAKIQSIMTSHENSITKLAEEIINDLNKLKLNPQNITADQFANKIVMDFQNILVPQLPIGKTNP